MQFKAIHFIGQPWYVEAAMAVIKPFLKEKTRSRIKLHGSNLSTLHDCIARDILPAELGGEGPSFNALDWVHQLLESSQGAVVGTKKPYHFTQTTVYSQPPPEYSKVVKEEDDMHKNEADKRAAHDNEDDDTKLIKSTAEVQNKEKNNNNFISNFNRTTTNGKLKPGDPARNSLLNID